MFCRDVDSVRKPIPRGRQLLPLQSAERGNFSFLPPERGQLLNFPLGHLERDFYKSPRNHLADQPPSRELWKPVAGDWSLAVLSPVSHNN